MGLTEKENANRNYLKEKKPYVYEKILKLDEKIRRGESIGIIQMQYNYQCNFQCIHCSIKRFQGKNPDRKMTVEDVRNLAEQADKMGLARFVITGGEPTTFQDLDQIVEAINPQKFYINCDSNGWLLTREKIKHMMEIGIDRIQLSIDGLNAKEHDEFRRKEGSHARTLEVIDDCIDLGMNIFVQTVVTKQRLHSEEFLQFIEFFNKKGIGVFVSFAKPVGAWERQYDCLIDKNDLAYFNELEKKYNVFSHLTPGYGLDMGCIAVKGMFSVTQYGDVLPCPYIHVSIGNIFEEPLQQIIDRGLGIKHFGEKRNTCLIAEDMDFIKNYIEAKVYDKPLPVPYNEVFSKEDITVDPFYNHLSR
ncbi:MAG: radical SAM protein [Clostridium sp.]|nr:radical SAM protein [Clostridium sp.]